MSELSKLFVKQKYHIAREMQVGPVTTRIWILKDDISYMIDVSPSQTCLLSVGDCPGWKKRLMTAGKICTEFMGVEPICRYDAKPSIQWTHFLEWDLVDPEGRLRVIVNRGEEQTQMPYRDLHLFGGYCINNFVDASLSQAYQDAANLSKKYPGVYGKDPGGECNAVRVLCASEMGLFLEYNLLYSARRLQQQYRQTSRPEEDLYSFVMHGATVSDLQLYHTNLALDFVAATICQKVGIAILEEPSREHRLCFDELNFIKWFNYHSEYLTRRCPDEQSMNEVMNIYFRGGDISAYAPTGDWRTA